ncbi:hypothetical protein PENCOP_c012G05290 [Penicillium coprophilum]|uniref:F-box domain-containing protein n=1 Tax=Penicillium coprophilum TaxID=36646 RepID=A0A1V6UC15_9EURO|nr:hypothetical protein PENCOP_c012G05290 [Penicillium coprophilum]
MSDLVERNLVSDLLSVLPVELLLCIADFLPLEDICCLSLCNHRLLAIFTSQTKHQVLERKAWLPFLRRLEYDHPHYLVCSDCWVLHTLDSIPEPLGLETYPTYAYPPRVDCARASQHHSPYHLSMITQNDHLDCFSLYKLHFSHLQLAMKRFYYGPQYGISTDALSFIEVTHESRWTDEVPTSTTLSSIEAKICPKTPSLVLRIQNLLSMSCEGSMVLDEYDGELDQDCFESFRVCKHHSIQFWMPSVAHDTYRVPSYSNCDVCNTDFEIQLFKNRPDGHVTMVMTRWINLGSGLSLDDPRWRVRTTDMSWSRPEITKLDPKYMHLSPRHAFEVLTDTSLENLTFRSLSYLENMRYESVMVPIPRHAYPFWALWNGAAVS